MKVKQGSLFHIDKLQEVPHAVMPGVLLSTARQKRHTSNAAVFLYLHVDGAMSQLGTV